MSGIQYRVDAMGGYWLPQEELDRLETETEQARAEASGELERERAEQALLVAKEIEAERERAGQPPSQDEIDELIQLRTDDLVAFNDQIDSIGERLATAVPVPSAEELGVDVSAFPPARAALVVYSAHLRQVEAEAKGLEGAKAKYLRDIGAPAETERAIDQLIKRDRSNVLKQLLSMGTIVPADIHATHRQELEEKLPVEKHAREVAVSVLNTLEVQIGIASWRLTYMRRRQEGFVSDALIEHAGIELAAEYVRRVKAAEEIIGSLLALGDVARVSASNGMTAYFHAVPDNLRVRLPLFRLAGLPDDVPLEIDCNRSMVGAAAEPWMQLAALWARSPTEDPPSPLIGGRN